MGCCRINRLSGNSQLKTRIPEQKPSSPCLPLPTLKPKIRKSKLCTVNVKTLSACKLGIARYPDLEYNAEGGVGTESAAEVDPVGSIYKAPPLLGKTALTSEESKGTMTSGRGERLDKQGNADWLVWQPLILLMTF
ncbi:hypothetical protein DVH24_024676 [Malus domestica]|uniref:Uncharacterized protein n=1 Tax=Malus domestica TaxID=3750 RepID=A0A498JN25_MALDO|nr:hypothetical protein DVH24_024676 [Malus domestica]